MMLVPFAIPYPVLAQNISIDSASYTEKIIKADIIALKRKNPTQIKRIETKDSTIVYGADKLRTHIVLVTCLDRLEKRNLYFMYDENGVIHIGVQKSIKKRALLGYKTKRSFYQFHNGRMIRSKGATEDIDSLIAEAGRFLRQGTILMKQLKKEAGL